MTAARRREHRSGKRQSMGAGKRNGTRIRLLFRAVGPAHLDVAIVAGSVDPDAPRVAADLAVLHERASHVRLEIIVTCSPQYGHVTSNSSSIAQRSAAAEQRRVEQHAERAERLAAPFRAEAEQHDVAGVELHVERGGFALQILLANQIAREQRRSGFLILGRARCP